MGCLLGVYVCDFFPSCSKIQLVFEKKIYNLIYGDVYTVVCLRLVLTLKKQQCKFVRVCIVI